MPVRIDAFIVASLRRSCRSRSDEMRNARAHQVLASAASRSTSPMRMVPFCGRTRSARRLRSASGPWHGPSQGPSSPENTSASEPAVSAFANHCVSVATSLHAARRMQAASLMGM